MHDLDLSRQSFLCVDDELFSRTLVRQLLVALGAREVEVAKDGAEALKYLIDNSNSVDCIVADFRMPRVNGLELLKAVRMGYKGIRKATPFAMLTGNSDQSLVDDAMALHVNAFLVKPISKDGLAIRLRRILPHARIKMVPGRMATRPLSEIVTKVENANLQRPINAEETDTYRCPPSDLPVGAILARDVLVSGVALYKAGASLEEADIRKLQGFSDLTELIGPVSDIWLRQSEAH